MKAVGSSETSTQTEYMKRYKNSKDYQYLDNIHIENLTPYTICKLTSIQIMYRKTLFLPYTQHSADSLQRQIG
jgi:hypothetical protein